MSILLKLKTMSNCCTGSYCQKFSAERAENEMSDYIRNGINQNYNPLIEEVKKLPVNGKSVLDIGAGIGLNIIELMKEGVKKATYVDISNEFANKFKKTIAKTRLSNDTSIIVGDFVKMHSSILSSDLVILDKSICCYEDYVSLVKLSIDKTRQWYAYTIPIDNWYGKLIYRYKALKKRIKGDDFKTFLHPTKSIEQYIEGKRFKKINQQVTNEWLTVLYERY